MAITIEIKQANLVLAINAVAPSANFSKDQHQKLVNLLEKFKSDLIGVGYTEGQVEVSVRESVPRAPRTKAVETPAPATPTGVPSAGKVS